MAEGVFFLFLERVVRGWDFPDPVGAENRNLLQDISPHTWDALSEENGSEKSYATERTGGKAKAGDKPRSPGTEVQSVLEFGTVGAPVDVRHDGGYEWKCSYGIEARRRRWWGEW